MKTKTVTVQEGEYLGPIDWDESRWPFQVSPQQLDWLRQLEANPDGFLATDDRGWPRCGWKSVIRVGMYDGWPYWRPGPAVLIDGTLGPEWIWANSLAEIRAWTQRPATG
jgi:hypothetical protein